MTFAGAVATCFKKYARFRGVATRSEFWYWRLFAFLVSLVASTLDSVISMKSGPVNFGGYQLDPSMITPIGSLIALAIALPDLAVTVRRLHDGGHSGHWLWLYFLPAILAIPLINAYSQYLITQTAPKPDAFLLACTLGTLVSAVAVTALLFAFFLQASKQGGNRYDR